MTPLLVIIIKLPPTNGANKCKTSEISVVVNISEEKSAVVSLVLVQRSNFMMAFIIRMTSDGVVALHCDIISMLSWVSYL